MRNLTVVAVLASSVMASPALARDNSWYIGVEGGVMKAHDSSLDYTLGAIQQDDVIEIDWKRGSDIGGVVGYDFGFLRLEGEVAYKRANDSQVIASTRLIATPPPVTDYDARISVLSGMANLLADFGNENGFSFYAGGGLGIARTKLKADFQPNALLIDGSDRRFAWQLIAGVRAAVTDRVDLGLKYRFFNARYKFNDRTPGGLDERIDGRFRSHSLLASLIFNLGAPAAEVLPPPAPPAPPPPPPPPATQTCPDGSVILATDQCPAPPPPPPPPPAAPERG